MTRAYRVICAPIVFALLACVATAQTPQLKIVVTATDTGGSRLIRLTNAYTSPVTAYVITEAGPVTQHGPRRVIKWQDSIPSEHGLRPALPAGGSATVMLPSGEGPVTNLAVIYADGATAGRPEVIAHLVRARQYYLAELPAVLQRLHAVEEDPGADRAALLADFRGRVANARSVLNDGVLPTTDRVTATVAETLRRHPGQNLQATAHALALLLYRWQRQLQASLPKLIEATGAAESTDGAPSRPRPPTGIRPQPTAGARKHSIP
jgi:hypothetical protein